MPIKKPKEIQDEIQKNIFHPIYWLAGPEDMKIRELINRLQNAYLGENQKNGLQILYGAETNSNEIIEASQSISLFSCKNFIVIKDAHALKSLDSLEPLLNQATSPEHELPCLCVFVSSQLDRRKKFIKNLIKKAPVVLCEEVPERDRSNWIQFLAKRRNQTLSLELITHLESLDPWSLDLIDQELEKLELSNGNTEVIQGLKTRIEANDFINAFFDCNKPKALSSIKFFAKSPDEAIPQLGLLSWYTRQLMEFQLRTPSHRNPYLEKNLSRWSSKWTVQKLNDLQKELASIDFDTKQTQKMPLAYWSNLILKFS